GRREPRAAAGDERPLAGELAVITGGAVERGPGERRADERRGVAARRLHAALDEVGDRFGVAEAVRGGGGPILYHHRHPPPRPAAGSRFRRPAWAHPGSGRGGRRRAAAARRPWRGPPAARRPPG